MNGEVLRVKKLSDKAILPIRSSTKAAGYDLSSAYDYTIPSMGKYLCQTDLQVAIPDGCYGRVAPRSGLASKFMIDVGAGVIDADYRGNVGVLLFNFGTEEYKVKAGERVAQLILERIRTPDVMLVDELDDTCRGENGFGSTGR